MPLIDGVALALSAFHAAAARVAAVPTEDELGMFAPLTESAWWAISIDEALDKAGGDGYRSARNSMPNGRTVAGLRYARNLLGHHHAFIAQRSGGLTVPFTVPFRFTVEIRWVGMLSLPDVGNHGDWAKPYYADHLAGRAVQDTLREASEWFDSFREEDASANVTLPDL